MNPWIAHVTKYARDHKIPYGDAMKKAKASYTKVPCTCEPAKKKKKSKK